MGGTATLIGGNNVCRAGIKSVGFLTAYVAAVTNARRRRQATSIGSLGTRIRLAFRCSPAQCFSSLRLPRKLRLWSVRQRPESPTCRDRGAGQRRPYFWRSRTLYLIAVRAYLPWFSSPEQGPEWFGPWREMVMDAAKRGIAYTCGHPSTTPCCRCFSRRWQPDSQSRSAGGLMCQSRSGTEARVASGPQHTLRRKPAPPWGARYCESPCLRVPAVISGT